MFVYIHTDCYLSMTCFLSWLSFIKTDKRHVINFDGWSCLNKLLLLRPSSVNSLTSWIKDCDSLNLNCNNNFIYFYFFVLTMASALSLNILNTFLLKGLLSSVFYLLGSDNNPPVVVRPFVCSMYISNRIT